jgi:hypothetical protein
MDLISVVLISSMACIWVCEKRAREAERQRRILIYQNSELIKLNRAHLLRSTQSYSLLHSIAEKVGVDDRKLHVVVHTDLHLEDMDYDGI